jgi:bacterioferritin-associated ferredoxin
VIACHCRVVSDRTVRAAISSGAASVADVAALCGAGAGCGGCAPSIEALLAEAAVAVASPERVAERQHRRRAAAGAPAFAPAG